MIEGQDREATTAIKSVLRQLRYVGDTDYDVCMQQVLDKWHQQSTIASAELNEINQKLRVFTNLLFPIPSFHRKFTIWYQIENHANQ